MKRLQTMKTFLDEYKDKHETFCDWVGRADQEVSATSDIFSDLDNLQAHIDHLEVTLHLCNSSYPSLSMEKGWITLCSTQTPAYLADVSLIVLVVIPSPITDSSYVAYPSQIQLAPYGFYSAYMCVWVYA